MRSNARKGPAIDETYLPKAAQAPEGHVFIATDKAHKLRRGGEAVTQNSLDDIEVSFDDVARSRCLRADEF
jgi:hypothetical protein